MQNWTIDETALRAAITPKTRAIILNSPHNPTGRVFTADELAIVADIAREHDLLVVSDEIYSTLVYDQHKHVSVLSLPGMQSSVPLSSRDCPRRTMPVAGASV